MRPYLCADAHAALIGQDDGVTEETWEDRVAEGQMLAAKAGAAEADARLVDLLLDSDDTVVTLRTALALLEQRTPRALRVVVAAAARADENQGDSLGDAVNSFRATSLGNDDEFLRKTLGVLAQDPDEECALAARELAVWSGLV